MVAAGNEVKQLSKDKIELKNEVDTIADLTRENERLKWEVKSAQEETVRVKVMIFVTACSIVVQLLFRSVYHISFRLFIFLLTYILSSLR